jgi:hypothetical protein
MGTTKKKADSLKELCRACGIGLSTGYLAAGAGTTMLSKTARRTLIERDDAEAWLKARRKDKRPMGYPRSVRASPSRNPTLQQGHPMRRRRVQFASAPCGAGKTYAIVRRTYEGVKAGDKYLLLQPTTDLIDITIKTEFDGRSNGLLVKPFHGNSVGRNVAEKLAEYLASPEDCPQVVLATHQVLPILPNSKQRSGWHLIFDELPQADRAGTHNLSAATHGLLTRHVQLIQHDALYSRVMPKDVHSLMTLARNPLGDDLLDALRTTAAVILNPHYRSFVHTERYAKLLNGSAEQLIVHSLLKAEVVAGFASVFMTGAYFEDAGVYHLWRDQVAFEEDEQFRERLRYSTHANGSLTDVYYATDRVWSRSMRSKTASQGLSNLDRFRRAAEAVLPKPYIWQANKVVPNSFLPERRIPNNPHGLNTYSDVHGIGFFSSLNPSPAHAAFLRHNGLSQQVIARMGYCTTVYQSIMRTSLRDPNNEDRKVVVVPDRMAADYVIEKLPGASVHKLDAGIDESAVIPRGRPRLHQNNAEKSGKRRARQKEARLARIGTQLEGYILPDDLEAGCDPFDTAKCRVESPLITSNYDPELSYACTVYTHVKSPTPECYVVHRNSHDFLKLLRALHERILDKKDDNMLFSPAIFDPSKIVIDDGGVRRRKARGNIVELRNMVLDFDGGDLKPEQIPVLFPGLKMVITNSHSHTGAQPRFRVIIFTEAAMTPTTYEAIFDQIVMKLEEAGYRRSARPGSNGLRSGLDHSKRSPTSLFYLPCQAVETKNSFFNVYWDGSRKHLDADAWAANLVSGPSITTHPPRGNEPSPDEATIRAAKDIFRLATSGEGNAGFFKLAVALKRAGMSSNELRNALLLEAANARSPVQRKAQISSVMTSLRKSGSS